MFGSLFLALGLVSCTAAGGHCDSPSTQLVRNEQTVQSRPAVSVTDSTDEGADPKQFEQTTVTPRRY